MQASDGEPAQVPDAALIAAGGRILDSFCMRPQGIDVVRVDAASGTGGAEAVTTTAPDGCMWGPLRQLLGSGSKWGCVASRALGFLNWRRDHAYCGRCGVRLETHPVEVARCCPACGRMDWPDVSPAVIVRVEKEGKILLARHAYRNRDVFACIAGHVEAGETAEECVHREVREETGLEVQQLCYRGSQHWPFPNQLMLAFTAQWASGELHLQASELDEAGWFDPEHLPRTPLPGSVAYRLIHGLF